MFFAGSERERVTVKVPRHGGPFSDTDPILKTEFNRACALRSLVPGHLGFAGWKIWQMAYGTPWHSAVQLLPATARDQARLGEFRGLAYVLAVVSHYLAGRTG